MSSLLSKEPVCRKEDCLLIDIGTVYRVISSFTDAEKFWFIESVWKPNLLFEFPASKETSGKQREFRRNIGEVKQSRMFSVMADKAKDVSIKESLLLSSAMSTLQRIFKRSFLVSTIVEQWLPYSAVDNLSFNCQPTGYWHITNSRPTLLSRKEINWK